MKDKIKKKNKKKKTTAIVSSVIEPKTAVAKLNQWIALKPGLKEALANTGLQHCAKQYTPAQVRLIVDALGEP